MTTPVSETPASPAAANPEGVVDPVVALLGDPRVQRVMGDGGALTDVDSPHGLDAEQLLDLFARLILLRVFDERAVAYQRQGRLGTYPMYSGEEAVQVGTVAAAQPGDWIFPSYRQASIGLLRGQGPEPSLRYWRGDARGLVDPRPLRVAPLATPVATHLPHAAGLAWAARQRGDDVASVAFFGDGATSAGDFHEGLNCAAVLGAPVVFVCTNNQWAISTPLHKQTRVSALADKGAAYGIPAVRVDGFDCVAMRLAAGEAFARAHGGGGPTLIEAVCYRIGPHGTADDPSLYRDAAEAGVWERVEPVRRMRGWLERRGAYPDGLEERLRSESRAEIEAAMQRIEADPPPPAEVLVDTLYAATPPALREQLGAWLDDAGGGEGR